MKQYDQFKDMLEDEIKSIAKKGDISPTELHSAYEIMSIIKNIDTVKAMEKAEKEEEGYSQRGGNSYRMPYMRSYGNMSNDHPMNEYSGNYSQNEGGTSNARAGRDADSDGQYSERRGRDAMGRFTSRDGGSYDGSYDGRSYGGSYDGRSYEGGTPNRGSYNRGGNYSRDAEHMINKLQMMMQEASSEKERQAIRDCMAQLGG